MKLDERRALLDEVRRRLLFRADRLGHSVLAITTGLIDAVIEEIRRDVPLSSAKFPSRPEPNWPAPTPDLFDPDLRKPRRRGPINDGSSASLGGFARAKALTPPERSAIARLAARARWANYERRKNARFVD